MLLVYDAEDRQLALSCTMCSKHNLGAFPALYQDRNRSGVAAGANRPRLASPRLAQPPARVPNHDQAGISASSNRQERLSRCKKPSLI
ncbi:MAG TPA: hypothetical protein DDY14_15965 [Chromatiaceae bacterium]|nr:hypothetical protein [Chromatiaceae bacterium]HCS88540.1 hypothetical protein [Chromatiaceae bacterium]